MNSLRIRILIAALAVLLGTALANSQIANDAQQPVHAREFGMDGHMMGFFADYLNLTDTQQAQMKAVIQKEHAAVKPLVQRLHQTREQLHQYEEGTYDEAKVRALAAQDAEAQVEITIAHTRTHSELFQLLTADQQSKMKEVEARHQARMQQRTQDAPPDAESNNDSQ